MFAIGGKTIGILEILLIFSIIFISTSIFYHMYKEYFGTDYSIEVISNHEKVVDIIRGDINKCATGAQQTTWKQDCKEEWNTKIIVDYFNNEEKLLNPYTKEMAIGANTISENYQSAVQLAKDPRLAVQGRGGADTSENLGYIFISDKKIPYKRGDSRKRTLYVSSCHSTPCVAAGNTTNTRILRN